MSVMLTERDLHFALDAIYRINTTEDVDSYARTAQSLLCSVITCEQEIFTVIDDVDGMAQSGKTYQWGKEALYLKEFKERGYERDTFLSAMHLKPNSYVMRDSDVMTDAERMKSRLYREIYQPQGVFYTLRISLIWHEKMLGQFAFFKAREAGDFSDYDVKLASLFAPHLALKFAQLRNAQTTEWARGSMKDEYGLTSREWEVVLLVVDGLSDDEIAQKLFISSSTVKKHLYNAYSKLGVSNRLQLKLCVGGQS